VKILIVAGGTGGHLYPGIAVARALSGHEVRFVVRRGDLGRDILTKEGFKVEEISGQGLPRSFSLKILTFPFNFLHGWGEARRLVDEFRPACVLAMGGYLSVPVVMQARHFGIRTLLHEQNVYPGLANRLLSRWADAVAVSFPASVSYFKGENVWVSGLPIRPDIGHISPADGCKRFNLELDVPTYLVFGGSLGAQRINTLAVSSWELLLKQDRKFQVIHITGTKDYERTEMRYRSLGMTARVLPYCHEMAYAYAAARSVLCRSGASTVAELMAARRPALLVPYPHASNNHQLYNAQIIEKAGWGRVVLDPELTATGIADYLSSTLPPIDASPADLDPQSEAHRLAAYLTSPPS
jgi:UDP-N-acetylglucosamine--N-acetylmuramyl-(pentapeptide) pyrophosphoryl-undecaprenol N-acetylglucosamine transferase